MLIILGVLPNIAIVLVPNRIGLDAFKLERSQSITSIMHVNEIDTKLFELFLLRQFITR